MLRESEREPDAATSLEATMFGTRDDPFRQTIAGQSHLTCVRNPAMPLWFEVAKYDSTGTDGMRLDRASPANQLSTAGWDHPDYKLDKRAPMMARLVARSARLRKEDCALYASAAAFDATCAALLAHEKLGLSRPDRNDAIRAAERALATFSDCTEAHNVLAMGSDSHEQCLEHYERAVESAQRCFADLPGLRAKYGGSSQGAWAGCAPLRAYVRALHGKANVLRKMERYREAIKAYFAVDELEGESWNLASDYINYRRHIPELFLACGDHKGCMKYMFKTCAHHRDKLFCMRSTKTCWVSCWILASYLEATATGRTPAEYDELWKEQQADDAGKQEGSRLRWLYDGIGGHMIASIMIGAGYCGAELPRGAQLPRSWVLPTDIETTPLSTEPADETASFLAAQAKIWLMYPKAVGYLVMLTKTYIMSFGPIYGPEQRAGELELDAAQALCDKYTAPDDRAELEEGVVVVCVGLVNAAEHNGTRAAVVSKEPCAESGRHTVQRLDTGVKLRLKAENMRLLLIPKGTVVEIFGLQNATEHNGQHGEVVGQSGKGTGRRYAVQMLTPQNSAEPARGDKTSARSKKKKKGKKVRRHSPQPLPHRLRVLSPAIPLIHPTLPRLLFRRHRSLARMFLHRSSLISSQSI